MANLVESMGQNEATDLTEIETADSDQSADDNSVSLEDVLRTEGAAREPGENKAGDGKPEGAADPQPGATADKPTLSQKDFDRAFGARADGLRKQFQREHAEELRIASRVKGMYAGMSADEILAKLDEQEAVELSAKTGWTKEESLQKVKARKAYAAPDSAGEVSSEDPHLKMLNAQVEQIARQKGVNMLEVIGNDPYLQEQINTKKMDIKDAYMYVMENRAPLKKGAPAVETRRSTADKPDGAHWSEAEIRRISERLHDGYTVNV